MKNAIDILTEVGAVLTKDHFVGTQGLHFDTYIDKNALYPHTEATSEMGMLFAKRYRNKGVEVVVAPALGGIILSQWVAYHLSKLDSREVCGIYTDKTPEGGQIFTRGYDRYVKDKKVLIVEDTTVKGKSVKKVIDAVRDAGGKIIGVCVMINRDPKNVNSETLGVPFESLSEYIVPDYESNKCPFCAAGIPINTKVGHGKQFLDNKNK